MKIKRILMPTDFSPCANAALDHALFLARKYQAELHLLHVLVLHEDEMGAKEPAFPGMAEIYGRVEKTARTELGRLLEPRVLDLVRVREVLRHGVAAAPTIAEYAGEESIDLLVIGTHGRRGLRRFLLGSVAEEVVRTVECPVITISDQEAAQRLVRPKRLLVPFDFSPGAEVALETGLQLAREYRAHLDLIHVVSPPIASAGHGMPAPTWSPVEVTSAIAEGLDARLAAEDSGLQARSHVLYGSAGVEIVGFAEDNQTDLIVIGSHGRHGVSRFLLGSVAEKVVRGAMCPVLVLRGSPEAEAADDKTVGAA